MQAAVNTRVHGARSLLGRFSHYAPQPREVAVAASLYRQKNDFRSGVGVIGGNQRTHVLGADLVSTKHGDVLP
jgi:hypothetical protein